MLNSSSLTSSNSFTERRYEFFRSRMEEYKETISDQKESLNESFNTTMSKMSTPKKERKKKTFVTLSSFSPPKITSQIPYDINMSPAQRFERRWLIKTGQLSINDIPKSETTYYNSVDPKTSTDLIKDEKIEEEEEEENFDEEKQSDNKINSKNKKQNANKEDENEDSQNEQEEKIENENANQNKNDNKNASEKENKNDNKLNIEVGKGDLQIEDLEDTTDDIKESSFDSNENEKKEENFNETETKIFLEEEEEEEIINENDNEEKSGSFLNEKPSDQQSSAVNINIPVKVAYTFRKSNNLKK